MLFQKKNEENLLYTKNHEWITKNNIKENYIILGITNYAQQQLGDIVYVDIPNKKNIFKSNDIIGELESVKSVGSIFMPIEGTILEFNELLIKHPELINEDPYKNGWILKIIPKNNNDISKMLTYMEYNNYLKKIS